MIMLLRHQQNNRQMRNQSNPNVDFSSDASHLETRHCPATTRSSHDSRAVQNTSYARITGTPYATMANRPDCSGDAFRGANSCSFHLLVTPAFVALQLVYEEWQGPDIFEGGMSKSQTQFGKPVPVVFVTSITRPSKSWMTCGTKEQRPGVRRSVYGVAFPVPFPFG